MSKQSKLIHLLRRLNAGEEPETVKQEAREFLASVTPQDLSMVEQELLEEGLDMGDFRQLCEVHMELLEDQLKQTREELPEGHVVRVMMGEHERILEFVDELESLNATIQQMDEYQPDREEFERLRHVAEHLVEAELHHQREEDVLFPELEERGVTGPPEVMRHEHEQMRARKKELQHLAESVPEMDFQEFKRRLDSAAGFIVGTLPDHIDKENNVLYPTAIQVIGESDLWDRMRDECDDIGYCCFTPEE